jgi:predicted HAD superfamily Cof-like phosphohydrolase
MREAFRAIVDFHRAIGHPVGETPRVPGERVASLRYDLIEEETDETLGAILRGDLPDIADGIADSIVVLLGTAVAYGIDLPEVWDAVQKSNMAKVGGPVREDGKQGRPPGWVPPDIASILATQRPLGELYPEREG